MSYTPLANPWTGIPLVGALIDNIQDYLETLTFGGVTTIQVTQTAHGFVVGNVLYYTGSAYALAKADTAAHAEVVGIVSAVADANDFTLLTIGQVTGLAGLSAGSVYWLSPTSAGALTVTEPSTAGQIDKPLLIATGTTQGIFFNFRGEVIAGSTTGSATLDFTDGALYKRFTITDSNVTTASNLTGAITRPNVTEQNDVGFVFVPQIVLVSNGSFDLVVQVLWLGQAVNGDPSDPGQRPQETVTFNYTRF